jgi:hypothetical protein
VPNGLVLVGMAALLFFRLISVTKVRLES